jgi:hypothetical protein
MAKPEGAFHFLVKHAMKKRMRGESRASTTGASSEISGLQKEFKRRISLPFLQ